MASEEFKTGEPSSKAAESTLRKCLEEVNAVMERHGVYGIAFASHLVENEDDQFRMHGSILVTDVPARVGQAEAMAHAAEEMVGDAVRDIRESIREAKQEAGIGVNEPGIQVRPPRLAHKPN